MRATEFTVNEVAMNPSTFASAIKQGGSEGVMVGYEFEVCVPKKTFTPKLKGPINYEDIVLKLFEQNVSFHNWYYSKRYAGGHTPVITPATFDKIFKIKSKAAIGEVKTLQDAIKSIEPRRRSWKNNYADLIIKIFDVSARTVESNMREYFDFDAKEAFKFLKKIPDLRYYVNYYLGGFGDRYKKAAEVIKKNLESFTGAETVIFDDYHQESKSLDMWYIEPDGSLSSQPDDTDLEIVSPPLPAEKAMDILKGFYQMARKLKLYTGADFGTGLHINVSIPKQLDVLKLAVFLGEPHVLQAFNRENNEYVYSVVKKLKEPRNSRQMFQTVDNRTELNKDYMKDLIDTLTSDHYSSISVSEGGRYISFRHAGGDYLNDYQSVVNVVGRFVQAMIIASDPNAYRKEYLSKLIKIVGAPKPKDSDERNYHANMRSLLNMFKKNGVPVIDASMIVEEYVTPSASMWSRSIRDLIQDPPILRRLLGRGDPDTVFMDIGTETAKKFFLELFPTQERFSTRFLERAKDYEPKMFGTATIHMDPFDSLSAETFNEMYELVRTNQILLTYGRDMDVVLLRFRTIPYTDPQAQGFIKEIMRQHLENAPDRRIDEAADGKLYYFAYGMLTDPKNMPGANLIGPAELRNHEFRMYKWANVEPENGSSVHGTLWEIDRKMLSQLDKVEDFPELYDRRVYPVYSQGQKYPAEVYIMTPNTKRYIQGTMPDRDYVRSLTRGYMNAGVPIDQLKNALAFASSQSGQRLEENQI